MTEHRVTATRLLCEGPTDDPSRESLLPLLYDEMRRLADRLMNAERAGHTLQATALVHEAWGRLIDPRELRGLGVDEARRRFLALAGRAMRRVLIDHARKRNADRRGGGSWKRVTFGGNEPVSELDRNQLLDLESALAALEESKPRLARIAELRLFAGMSPQETAAALDISQTTAVREWAVARAVLSQQLAD